MFDEQFNDRQVGMLVFCKERLLNNKIDYATKFTTALFQILSDYKESNKNYVGDYEAKQYHDMFKEWEKDGSDCICKVVVNNTTNMEDMLDPLIWYGNQESVGMSDINASTDLFVVGVYDKNRLEEFLQSVS